ncbi:MAG: nucleotide exchange factor GrpE [Deltaproteobacteria bacterium]|nr:nucleotide exchange factor GrpE [Deltaproteobacteria bacterium]
MSEDTKHSTDSLEDNDTTANNAAEASTESSDLESELTLLRQQLKSKDEEAKQNFDRFMRQTAELENFKKRASRDKEEAIRFANDALVKELLPVVDNLERALLHAKGVGNGESLVEGVEMTLKGLFESLGKHGVVQISAIGQPFDPQVHEAMAQIESDSNEPNTVLDEHQKGYLIKERLLRPALVTVVKAIKSNEKKNGDDEVENKPTDD